MWNCERVVNKTIEIFSYVCSGLNLNGSLEENQMGNYFITIIAPDGGKRRIAIIPEMLLEVVDGWDKSRAIWELKSHLLHRLVVGDIESTPITELTEDDFNYFQKVNLKLYDFMSQIQDKMMIFIIYDGIIFLIALVGSIVQRKRILKNKKRSCKGGRHAKGKENYWYVLKQKKGIGK